MRHESILTELLKTKTFHTYHQTVTTLIGWIEEDEIVYNYHKGFVTREDYREHGSKLVEVIKKHSAQRIFNHVVDMQVIPLAEQQWTREVLIPQAIAAGLKASAYMVPESVLEQLSVEKLAAAIKEAAQGHFIALPFEDEVKAYEWLQAQKV